MLSAATVEWFWQYLVFCFLVLCLPTLYVTIVIIHCEGSDISQLVAFIDSWIVSIAHIKVIIL